MKRKQVPPSLSPDELLKLFRKERRPLSFGELLKTFSLFGKQKRELKALIKHLMKEGAIVRLKNKRFGVPLEMNLQTGTLWCTRSGNGFVTPEKQEGRDIFVASRFIKDAFHGDKVIIRVEHTVSGRKEGRIVKVVERRTKHIVGFVRRQRNIMLLTPEDERISHHFIVEESGEAGKCNDGDLVAARVSRYPEEGSDPVCKIVKVFRELKDIRSIIQFVQYKHSLPLRFKRGTEAGAPGSDATPVVEGRLDLRGTKHVTIDGEFAKDFDDAVCVEKTNDGYTLYVSIADVSHYVPPDSALDKEAYERGTSIYFPGTVIPMLPKGLSNVICSLNPREERLTVTAKLTYNRRGDLVTSSFHESIIRSARRLTYREVEAAAVRKEKGVRAQLRGVVRDLERMAELARLLARKREERESLDFDLPEPEVILDIEGGLKDILKTERLFSHRIIEEFMIAANEAVAAYLTEKDIPTMYRIHEPPEKEKLQDFERLLNTLSVQYGKRTKHGLPLQEILSSVKGTDYEFLVNRVLLRSMKQAKYSAVNKGHYGLASHAYLHFTSPIRRYPDLVCHRVLKKALRGTNHGYGETELEQMAAHLSDRERVAMEAEREIEDRIKVLYMKDRIGEEYEGIISHITSYGFFVEPFDVFVEGIVLLSELYDDYYLFQEEQFRLMGRRSRKTYRIGDKVRVKVVMANVEKNQLHFTLA
jgi:ribonuclease R